MATEDGAPLVFLMGFNCFEITKPGAAPVDLVPADGWPISGLVTSPDFDASSRATHLPKKSSKKKKEEKRKRISIRILAIN